MLEGCNEIERCLGTLPDHEFRFAIRKACSSLFEMLFGLDISTQGYIPKSESGSRTKRDAWIALLRNALITLWEDSANPQILERDSLMEEVYGIDECLDHIGYESADYWNLIAPFMPNTK